MALYMYILYRLRDTAHYWFYTSTVFMAAALIALHKFHYKAGRKFNPFTNISSDKFIFEYTNLILTFKYIILHRYALCNATDQYVFCSMQQQLSRYCSWLSEMSDCVTIIQDK